MKRNDTIKHSFSLAQQYLVFRKCIFKYTVYTFYRMCLYGKMKKMRGKKNAFVFWSHLYISLLCANYSFIIVDVFFKKNIYTYIFGNGDI